MKFIMILATSLMLILLIACGGTKEESEYIPDGNYQYAIPLQTDDGWSTNSTDSVGLNIDVLEVMITKMVTGLFPKIDGMLIIKNDQLVFEEYFNTYHRERKHDMTSMTDVLDSISVGQALENGSLTAVEEAVYDYLPNYHDLDWGNGKSSITISDLLTMRTGIECENGFQGSCNSSELEEQNDWTRYSLGQEMSNAPGEVFSYFAGLSSIVRAALVNINQTSYDSFVSQNIFAPLNISDVNWNKSPSGEVTSVSMLPRDMAKLGKLFLNNGIFDQQLVVGSDWVSQSLTPRIASPQANGGGFGYLWWLGQIGTAQYDYFAAIGNGGQYVFVIPELEMIVVITSSFETGTGHYLMNEFVLPALM